MRKKNKIITTTAISFTAGTGFGLFICTTILAFIIKYNENICKNFFVDIINNSIQKIVYGKEKNKRMHTAIRYNTPSKVS